LIKGNFLKKQLACFFLTCSNKTLTVLFMYKLTTVFFASGLIAASGSLVAYYPLDGDFTDASGNGNDGVMLGGVSYGAGAGAIGGGQSAVFDGAAGTYGSIEGGLQLVRNETFSVAMWVNADGTANRDKRIFSEGTSTNNNPLFNVGTANNANNGTVDIYIRNGASLNHPRSTGEAFDGTWHHVAFSGGSDGLLDLYIDGAFDTTFDYSAIPAFGELNTTTIGGILRGSDCCNFNGSIDDVSFWDSDLTTGEISALAGGASATSLSGIPEPTSAVLCLTGLIFALRRRR
jgi:hypothetical protein